MRFALAAVAAALAIAPAPLAAQDNVTEPPPAEPVGPRELENFSLNGTVTREAEQPEQPPAPAPRPAEPAAPRTTEPAAPSASRPTAAQPAPRAPPQPVAPAPAALPPTAAPAPSFSAPPLPPAALPPTETATDGPAFAWLPWALALLAAAGAAAWFVWRRRHPRQPAYAGGLAFDSPRPEPQPAPRPQPPAAAPRLAPMPQPAPRPAPMPAPQPAPPPPRPAPTIVASSLRPIVDIAFSPTRLVLDADKATVHFEVAVVNDGSAPARDVLIEVGIFNAGPEQEAEIARYQAKPPGSGPRIATLPPLGRLAHSNRIAVAVDKLRLFDAGGRRFFVPLLLFNAYYSWSGGEGRTALAFLIGRKPQSGDKLAPFTVDQGPRQFRNLEARLLPQAIRA